MTCHFGKPCPRTGYPSEKLLAYAARFDILLTDVQGAKACLSVLTPQGWSHAWLPLQCVSGRLLAELGSRTAPWVAYKVGVPCLDTLLARSPEQLEKLVDRYHEHRRLAGFSPTAQLYSEPPSDG